MSGVARLVVPAPAKVNLFLHVTGQRADGYHSIESLFALVDFADRIEVELRDDGVIARVGAVPGVPERDDLTIRAARLLRSSAGIDVGCSIRIDKKIPLGAGLGGGSSDAASVMLALNRLWKLSLSRNELASIGLSLGADVPFFVHGENALVTGIGECIAPVSLPRRWLALALPRAQVATRDVFAARELTRSTPSAKISVFSESYGHNDLAAVVTSRYPDVERALSAMRSRVTTARMTGSGAGVVAVCASSEAAQSVIEDLPSGTPGRVVRTLGRHPLAAF
ncbi:MAG TPA: 4-(cytidine 5'-diphospho)-2-C-methyl-D-erythritol kinase [Casimicrobiaceae bacterium]|nr:4-(cytidine 5'-diphospho)-2-C-methyl-D-erythritol kinase [Casimicrobiaceae bacterium]